MKLITKKTRLVATVAVVCLTLVAGIWIYTGISQNVSAGGVAYNPHSPTHTGCSSICYDRKKMGVAWIFYPFDPAYGYDAGSQTIDAPNTPEGKYDVSECIRVGATGYYRSGWIYYYKNNMRPAMVNGVYQYGYFLASEVSFAGGNGIYYDALPGHSLGEIGAEDWGVVRSYFALAEANGATLGHSWPDTSLFCFNPEWTHKPDPISGNGHFESKSKITAIAGGDIPGGIEAETDWDGTGEIRYSTDQSSVNIKFQHSIHYVNESIPTHEDQACCADANTCYSHCAGNDHNYNDTYASAETKYKVTSMVGGTNSDVGSGDYSSAVNKTTDPTEKYNNTVNVSLAPGETKIVCQAMSYQYKNFTVNGNEHTESGMDGLIPWETKWHSYEDPQGSGQGSSQVCATITRPRESDTGDGTGGTGSTDGDVMYAGEQAQVSWNVNGINTDSRRLLGWEAVVYRIPVGVANSSSLYTGTRGFLYGNQPKDVCSWYGSWDYCSVLSGRSGNFGTGGQSHSYNEAATIVVPDTVGYKYCNSFGYHYQYFWYSSNTGWHGDKTYWRVHDASCRTIAKKPTAAIWNGSLMTNRGVITSSAPRFDNATMGTEASSGGSRTLFGSWTEYLGAIGSNVNGFASGSSFAIGSKDLTAPRSNPLNRNNSSLTIANSDRLGGSGIGNNTTTRTRLTTFLEKQAVRPGGGYSDRDGECFSDANFALRW